VRSSNESDLAAQVRDGAAALPSRRGGMPELDIKPLLGQSLLLNQLLLAIVYTLIVA